MDGELAALRQKAAEREESVKTIKAKIRTAPSIYEKRGLEKRLRKRERFLKVKELRAKGYPIRQIALSLQMHRRTVRLYMKSDDLPERKKPTRSNELRKYLSYLEQQWAEGERNAAKLGREIKERGYRGKVSTVVC